MIIPLFVIYVLFQCLCKTFKTETINFKGQVVHMDMDSSFLNI